MSASVHVNARVTEPVLHQCVNYRRLGLHVMPSLDVPCIQAFMCSHVFCSLGNTHSVCVCVCGLVYVGLSCVTLCVCVIVSV